MAAASGARGQQPSITKDTAMSARISRRRLLIGLGVMLVGGAGLASIALRRPPVSLTRTVCDGEEAMPKVLLAYATRAGSTAEVAERIAQRLCMKGFSAEAMPVDDVADLSGYDVALLGSGTYYGGWLGAMTGFVQAHAEPLRRLPVAFFTLHMQNLGATPEAQAERLKYTAVARAAVTPVDEAFFAGRVDPSRLNLLERLAVRLVGSPIGDLRDWNEIDAWADGLVARFANT
jgi:menaquinone-dependent protoporphyrinogen oxidase